VQAAPRGVRFRRPALRAPLARAGRALALRRAERADSPAQRVVPRRDPPADGSADGRLHPALGPLLPPPGARTRMGSRALPGGLTSRRAAAVLLFLGGVAISAVTILRGVDPFDEGLALQAARRVAQGQVPYRDFLWAYGPAQIYLLGGLFKLVGTSLLQWRLVRALVDGGVALTAFVLLRREAGPGVALAGWLAAATVMAQPR